MSKKKWKRGNQISCFDELVNQRFVFWHEKVYHKGWFMWWQMGFVKYQIECGNLYHAMRKED